MGRGLLFIILGKRHYVLFNDYLICSTNSIMCSPQPLPPVVYISTPYYISNIPLTNSRTNPLNIALNLRSVYKTRSWLDGVIS